MRRAEAVVERARCPEFYPSELDIQQFKLDYATVMATLEEALSERRVAELTDDKCSAESLQVLTADNIYPIDLLTLPDHTACGVAIAG